MFLLCNQYRLLGVIKWGYIWLDNINTFKILKVNKSLFTNIK